MQKSVPVGFHIHREKHRIKTDGKTVGTYFRFVLSQISALVLTLWPVALCWTYSTALALILPHYSYTLFNFPHFLFLSLTCRSAGGHPLCLRCLTMEIWRPKLRWTEQHSSQIRTPRLILVQPGSDRKIKDTWMA